MFTKYFDFIFIFTNILPFIKLPIIPCFLCIFVNFIYCLLLPMACVFGHQRESSATEDSENDDKVKYAFSVLFA